MLDIYLNVLYIHTLAMGVLYYVVTVLCDKNTALSLGKNVKHYKSLNKRVKMTRKAK